MGHRRPVSARPMSRLRTAAFALGASLAASIVVLCGSVLDAGPGHLLVTAAAVTVVTAVLLATTIHHVVQPLPVRVGSSGVAGTVPASTAYWCALEAPTCPQRPRAPVRH